MANVRIYNANGDAGGISMTLPRDLRDAIGELVAPRRSKVYSEMGTVVAQMTREYISSIAPQNHKTANSFTPPAKPTGNLEKAAQHTGFKVVPNGVEVFVSAAGITRAFHPLHIQAKGKLLTIPARTAPEAYGKRARELSEKLFFIRTASGVRMLATPTKETDGGKPYIAKPHRVKPDRARRPGRVRMEVKQNFRPVYWLRSSVTVPQKRRILPSNAQFAKAAREGAARGVRAVFAEEGITTK